MLRNFQTNADPVAMATMNLSLESVYRKESRRVFSTLVRLLGSFDIAEEALHGAFMAARACRQRNQRGKLSACQSAAKVYNCSVTLVDYAFRRHE